MCNKRCRCIVREIDHGFKAFYAEKKMQNKKIKKERLQAVISDKWLKQFSSMRQKLVAILLKNQAHNEITLYQGTA